MRRAVTVLSILALLFPATGVEAGTPTTWGRMKRLYASGDRVDPGPGVTAAEAERAAGAVRSHQTFGIEGPVRVIRGEEGPEGVLIVLGATADGREGAHLVGAAGHYLGGAIVDPEAGLVLDARSGDPLYRASGATLRQELREFQTEGIREALESICKGLAFGIFSKCAASMVGNPVGELGCLALLLVLVLWCQGDLHFKRIHDGDCLGSALQSGGSLGHYCN